MSPSVYIRLVLGDGDAGDKIELSLEQRHVAILAVAALVLLGVVFALGVMVGRQLASASLAAPTQPPAGDLRALDAAKPPAKNEPQAQAVDAIKPVAPAPPAAQAAAVDALAHAKAVPSLPDASAYPATPPPPAEPPTPEELSADDDDDSPEAGVSVAAQKSFVVPAPKDQEGPLPPLPEHLGKYTVQFGSTQSRKDAQQLQARAQAQGLKPYIVAAHLGAKGTWYRLRAGAFENRDEAIAYQKDIDRELHVRSAVMPTK